MIQTSIIIPVHNNWSCISDCIESITINTNNYELIFIVDSSVMFSESLKKYGEVIYGKHPFVFSERINLGIKEAEGEYICLLNDDVMPYKDWLVKTIEANKQLGPGLVGVRCQEHGCSNVDAHGKGSACYTNYTINMFAMLIPRRVLDIVGLLDERFIYYGGDDDDYCLRALRHGFKLIISSGFVYHKKSTAFNSGMIRDLLPKTRKVFIDKWTADMPCPPKQSWVDDVRKRLIQPSISVLMPTRGHEKYIKSAVMSVFAQSYKNIQLIVGVDGKDQPETFKILKKIYDDNFAHRNPRFLVLKTNDTVGSCDMRNRCFEYAYGEFIALMDSDDIMHPDRLKDELEAMTPDTDIIYSAYIEEDKNGKQKPLKLYPFDKEMVLNFRVNKNMLLNFQVNIAGGTFLMRKYCLEKEKFDEKYARAFDFEYALRTHNKFKYRYLDKPTIVYRRHSGEHLSGNLISSRQHKELIGIYKNER